MMKLREYMRSKAWTILAFFLFFLIVFLCLYLYGIETEILWYPFFLCLLAGTAFLTAGYFRSRRGCRTLESLCRGKTGISEELPGAVSPEEERCFQIIRKLDAECTALRNGYDRKFSEMEDYYAAWVHQIKTPIASLRLKLQSVDSEESREMLRQLGRIEQYVEMVMTYLRLDSANTDYVICEHDLDDIVRAEIRKVSAEFIAKRLRLEYREMNRTVLTDEKWMGFVIGQILSNALKYTKEGCITVFSEGDVLCISDTGIGIDEADIPRVFEKGFTGFNGRMDKHASGIGLYLCRRICDALGHEISIESYEGVGTTVKLDLHVDRFEIE